MEAGGTPPRRERQQGSPEAAEASQGTIQPEEGWGNVRAKEAILALRIGLLNHGGFPPEAAHGKNHDIREFVSKHGFDVVGLTENNLNWQKVPVQNRLHERTRGWFEALHLTTAYYQAFNGISEFLPGGVSLWSMKQAAHRVMESGRDATGLGRWVWTRYRGRGVTLRIVAAYRPVLNRSGPMSVWNQHKAYYDEKKIDGCPRDLFTRELVAQVTEWMLTGDQIVLMTDANEDVRCGDFVKKLRKVGLTETIIDQHGHQGPATHQRGSVPIDGIFVTDTLQGCKCGYLPLTFDHRGLWIDIPMTVAFGHALPPISSPAARRLKCEDPRIVKAYQLTYDAYLVKNKVYEQAQTLYKKVINNECQKQEIRYEWNRIDKVRVIGMMEADKKCRQLYMGGIPWSPTLQAARHKVDAWNLMLKHLNGGKVNSKVLQRRMQIAHVVPGQRTLEEAKDARTAAYREVKRVKKKALTQRTSWLESLAAARAAEGNLTADQEVKNLLRKEQQRRDARIIRRANDKLRSGGIHAVIAPDEHGEWVEYNLKSDIEKALASENERRFRQASDTPFLQPPLYDLVGPLGTGPSVADILSGCFQPPPGLDPFLQKFIEQLARPPMVLPRCVSLDLSAMDHITGWAKAKERTSSGPSGIHFGHFKAGALHANISELEHQLAHIPYVSGISPERWRQGTNVMLEKSKGNFRVDKLRAILLFEADFNHNNKKIGREMMYTAESLAAIAPEQYGSRKKLSAIDHCLNKRLTFDLARQKRRPLGLCANDAKSCYDRIVHSIASIAMQRLGTPPEPIICMFDTLQNLKHYIRTIYGDSKFSFGGDIWVAKIPIQGVGQGNGAGPQIWAAVSTPILNLLREEGHGVFYKTAIAGEAIHFVAYSFVDNTDLVAGSLDREATGQKVAEDLQKALHMWERGLHATGGAIVPSKTHWYLVDFKWDNGKWAYCSIEDAPAELKVRDCDGVTQTLERLPVTEARRTLGVRLAPDGNNNAEFKFLRAEARKWADGIRTGHLPRHLAWQSLQTTILRKLEYPLAATTFSPKQCYEILKPVLQQGLPSSGIVRTIPRVIVHGPVACQGVGIPDLWTVQGLAHLDRLIKYGSVADHFNGQLIRASTEQMKLELGINGPLFSTDYETYKELATECWVKNSWEFLARNNLRVEDATPDFPLMRENDRLLMPTFLDAGIPTHILKRINLCRLYLQVLSLADITTGGGKTISQAAQSGNEFTSLRESYDWPMQSKPPESDWILWRAALQESVLTPQGHLIFTLGLWLHPTPPEWQWFYAPDEERLYRREGEQVWYYPKLVARASRSAVLRFTSKFTGKVIPSTAERATVTQARSTIYLQGYAATVPEVHQSPTKSLHQVLADLPSSAQWAVQQVRCSDNGAKIVEAIRNGTCIAVSDGSFKDEYGTAAWVLEGRTSEGRIEGVGIIPGEPKIQGAYRSELGGLYGIATIIHILCQVHSIEQGAVEIGCDGLAALRNGVAGDGQIKPQAPQFDLIAALQGQMHKSPITWKPRHVKGHQDNNVDAELDRWAKLNIEMDEKAKLHWATTCDVARNPEQHLLEEPWSAWIGDKKVSKDLRSTIIDHIHGTAIKAYWAHRERFGETKADAIDWTATADVMNALPRPRRIWVAKHVSGFCGTGKMMQRWKKRPSAACPRCGTECEDATHVWRCPEKEATAVWKTGLGRVDTWMRKEKTQPDIRRTIISRLEAWRTQQHANNAGSTYPGVPTATAEQDKAGWQSFFEGCPVRGWAEAQHTYFVWIGSRRSGRRWLAALLQKLLDVAWDLWEQRNAILHKQDSAILYAEFDQGIREQFSLGTTHLPREVKGFFRTGLKAVLQYAAPVKQAWLRRVEQARKRAMDRLRAENIRPYEQERRTMERWLRAGRQETTS